MAEVGADDPAAPLSGDAAERAELEAAGLLFPQQGKAGSTALGGGKGSRSMEPNIREGGIVFGYAQSYSSSGTYVDFYRWEALTHVGSTFIEFDSTGNLTNPATWTGRDALLRAGGAAQAAGTKVIMVVLNEGFDVNVINTVMTTPAARSTLVDDIVDLLDNVGEYSHGVSFDFEPFSWSSAARDGMTLFFQELRSDLDAAGLTSHEISLYGDPTPSNTQWGTTSIGFAPYLDYLLYSGYDFASGLTPNSITEHDSAVANMDYYFDRGIEPEKFVYVISSYSRNWTGTNTYGVAGTTDTSEGFTDGLYDTTLNPRFGGPFTLNYVTGDESGWYTYNDGVDDHVVTFESPESLAMKVGSALSYPGTGTAWDGRKLGGVGFWSLMWMAETAAWDPIAAAASAKTRTYPQIYQACQELLAPAGTEEFIVAGFEGLNFRWRDPNEGPDDVGDSDTDSARLIVTAPAGVGRPASTTNAMRVTYDFETASVGTPGKLFFRHEMLAANEAAVQNSVIDTNAAAAFFDATTEILTYVYCPTPGANATLRMVVMDRDRELEMSPPYSLATGSTWGTFTWDLTAGVTAYTTAEPAFLSGDGFLDTAGAGATDIAFAGFVIQSTSPTASAQVIVDEITYRHANAGGLDYKINEVRYDGSTGEFVEIYGPAGPLPAGFQIRAIDGAAGSITGFPPIVASIPNDGGGFGFLVVGDSDVPNVDITTGFTLGGNNLPDGDPSAVQLYNSTDGGVYDSLVYEAHGGLDNLLRGTMLGVANEGAPWFGRSASGTNAASVKHSAGRYPDGQDTDVNATDFSLMSASPGAANGGTLTAAGTTTFNFTSAPSQAFTTFQSVKAVASGVGASTDGGNVLRTADSTGGGVITYIGDGALGADGNGYNIDGEIFLPNSAAPAQAIGIGFCGGQGSTFFSTTRSNSSYENGYWLIYENNASADLDDGLASHPGIVHFVMASHDNQDGNPVVSLGSLDVSSMAGSWRRFDLNINPGGNTLTAKLGGSIVYSGSIPTGGRTSGPVMVGFREFDGSVTSVEGTWIDGLRVGPQGSLPVGLTGFSIQ